MKYYFNIQENNQCYKGIIETKYPETNFFNVTEMMKPETQITSYFKTFQEKEDMSFFIKRELKRFFNMPNGKVRFYS
jgi:hypothetical protein